MTATASPWAILRLGPLKSAELLNLLSELRVSHIDVERIIGPLALGCLSLHQNAAGLLQAVLQHGACSAALGHYGVHVHSCAFGPRQRRHNAMRDAWSSLIKAAATALRK